MAAQKWTCRVQSTHLHGEQINVQVAIVDAAGRPNGPTMTMMYPPGAEPRAGAYLEISAKEVSFEPKAG